MHTCADAATRMVVCSDVLAACRRKDLSPSRLDWVHKKCYMLASLSYGTVGLWVALGGDGVSVSGSITLKSAWRTLNHYVVELLAMLHLRDTQVWTQHAHNRVPCVQAAC
jgi:hypothetical protein